MARRQLRTSLLDVVNLATVLSGSDAARLADAFRWNSEGAAVRYHFAR
jgi:hypothetical protein